MLSIIKELRYFKKEGFMPPFDGNNHEQHEIDNRADQLNPNNDAYWSSREDDEEDGYNYGW